jgi:hypothetical protein
MRWIVALAAVSLAGCVTAPSGAGSEPPRQVTFETTPCFGSCPVFSLTLDADGHGIYQGGRFVKTKGRHEFSASPKQVRAFFDRLRPFRPRGAATYDMANCPGPAHTDAPSVKVRWISATRADSLDWYLGCQVAALKDIEPDLQNAWQELPLDDLVGRAQNRFEYDRRGG